MPTTITHEAPDAPDAQILIDELDEALEDLYPRESRHGYSVDKLLAEGIPFFVLRVDGIPAACGGIKLFGTDYGEVKRMYVRPAFRRQGLSRLVLEHLAAFARQNGVHRLRLETGIHQKAAIAHYEGWGFRPIPPFGDYREDPLSLFYEIDID